VYLGELNESHGWLGPKPTFFCFDTSPDCRRVKNRPKESAKKFPIIFTESVSEWTGWKTFIVTPSEINSISQKGYQNLWQLMVNASIKTETPENVIHKMPTLRVSILTYIKEGIDIPYESVCGQIYDGDVNHLIDLGAYSENILSSDTEEMYVDKVFLYRHPQLDNLAYVLMVQGKVVEYHTLYHILTEKSFNESFAFWLSGKYNEIVDKENAAFQAKQNTAVKAYVTKVNGRKLKCQK
jgi:hypothetical protein